MSRRTHLDGPARQQGAEGDAYVGHGAEIGAECLRSVPSVVPDERKPRTRGRPEPAARIQFRRVSGLIPRSAATYLIVVSGRDSYNATESALNSAE